MFLLRVVVQVIVTVKVVQSIVASKITGALSKVSNNAVNMAKGWQGNGDYPGVDNWVSTTIKKGTKVWGGSPGQSNFYTSDEVVKATRGDATKLFEGLQVGKGNFPQYRPGMTMYKVTKDIKAASSKAFANPQYGDGGFEQFFIPNYQDALKPIKSIILFNK